MSQPNKKDALGKGIRSLLQNIDSDLKNTAGALSQEVVEQASSAMRMNMAGAPAGGASPPSKCTGVQAWKPMVA